MITDSSPVMTEAKAKIIWGESPDSVRDFLISNGMSKTDADTKIKEFKDERNAEIRGLAVKSIVIGVVLIIVACFLWFMIFHTLEHSRRVIRGIRGSGAVVGASVFAGIYGLWKIVNGIFDLFRPQSEKGSLSEMDADE
jgi:hypothetical protein